MSERGYDMAVDIVRELWLHTPRSTEEWDAIASVAAQLTQYAAEQTAALKAERDLFKAQARHPIVPGLSVDCVSQGCRRAEFESRVVEADEELERRMLALRSLVARLPERLEAEQMNAIDPNYDVGYRSGYNMGVTACVNAVRALLADPEGQRVQQDAKDLAVKKLVKILEKLPDDDVRRRVILAAAALSGVVMR